MESLVEMVAHKLKFMAQYTDDSTQISNEQLAEILNKEKKKQSLNDVIEIRLCQTIITQKTTTPHQVEYFLHNLENFIKHRTN